MPSDQITQYANHFYSRFQYIYDLSFSENDRCLGSALTKESRMRVNAITRLRSLLVTGSYRSLFLLISLLIHLSTS